MYDSAPLSSALLNLELATLLPPVVLPSYADPVATAGDALRAPLPGEPALYGCVPASLQVSRCTLSVSEPVITPVDINIGI